VTLSPSVIVILFPASASILSTTTVTSSVPDIVPSETSTESVVVTIGFTEILLVLSPLFHLYMAPPEAVSVTISPAQIDTSFPAEAAICSFSRDETSTLTVSKSTHPFLST